MKKILITGGAGFIGSHLCNFYLDKNFNVTCLDNLSSGNINNLTKFQDNKNFQFINFDISNGIEIKNNFDIVLNFACPASPKYYLKHPLDTAAASIKGVYNILDFCLKNNSILLHASTSEVYGDPHVHPQNETYFGNVNTVGPRSCYDEGKRVAEMLIYEYYKKFDLDCKIIRIFNTYGPNMDPNDGRVVSNFINQAIANEPITIYGDGKQTRSFCFIDDLVEGIDSYLNLNEKFIGPINLGNPGEFNMNELAERVLKLTKSSSKIVYKDLPINDPLMRKPDITLALNKLNFNPKIDIHNGLIKTIKYFKKL
jgi:UDP-glucuronate decarboxylase